ncbi:pentatricopeptide repeat-containing protein At4g02750-like [Phoenix dactylifera]|uniref:Pentatricopeptide repeat-containing protein At4g02750-like n=1 Tax=Phoenix dactylifera TaxID=42345 RepID=A0A8B7CTK2_PHODC|nr:pentatricopeptide repeat-containing protein At4g02750-like [Phoenix dactylifera]
MPVKNEVSWRAIISDYSGKGELDVPQSLFDKMPVGRNIMTWNSMASAFARRELLLLARKLFDKMPIRNVMSWNSMVSVYALNGYMDLVRELFDLMPERGTKPNDITFVGMLTAYTHSGLADEGCRYFVNMSKVYGVQPEMKHYGCIVDLLIRAWIHIEIGIVDEVRSQVLKLEHQQSGYCVVLSNICAAASRWDDASKYEDFIEA